MNLSFGVAIIVGMALEFFIQANFPSLFPVKNLDDLSPFFAGIVGVGTGLLCGFYVRYRVLKDEDGKRSPEVLGLFLGFAVGYPFYGVIYRGMTLSSGLAMLTAEVMLYLIFYQRAVKLRRSRRS